MNAALLCRLAPVLVWLALGLAGGGLTLIWVSAGSAQALVADLSSHLIAITTGFTGTEVVLFGATDGPGEVAVVVVGPGSKVIVRRKEPIAGVWMNRRAVTFDQVPSYYAVAASQPADRLAPPAVLGRHDIGLDHLPLVAESDGMTPEQLAPFRAALIRTRQGEGLYGVGEGRVVFLGERLFRTTISFPAEVTTGAYAIRVFLIRDKDVVSAQTTPLIVNKIGVSAEISEIAQRRPVLYGLIAVFCAVAIGWLAGTLVGRL